MRMNFSKLLLQYRERAGLSKTELAQKIGLSPGYIMNLESGRRKPPTFERCEKIAHLLNLSKEEQKEFYRVAWEERAGDNDNRFLLELKKHAELVIDRTEQIMQKIKDTPVQKVPVVSWVHANKFDNIEDPFPAGITDEYIYSTIKGEHIFALRVHNDCMEPEFREGDLIIIKPNVNITSGDYIIVADRDENKATFKQYKEYGNKKILHPLNPKYQDIELDHKKRYVVVGKIVEKVKKY